MTKEMPSITVTQSSLPSFDEYIEEIRSIFESRWLSNMGPKHQELETALSNYLSVDYVSLFVNGHTALEYCLQAYELQGEVITTPFTFISTTNAIVRSGLTPIFCDIKANDFTIDPIKIEEKITDNTCAIVPVHVYGNVCDVEAIARIADKYGLKVIYDAAHAFGVRVGGKPVGVFGDASMFSFHATKVFHTIEGGAVVTSDAALYAKLACVKNFGISGQDIADYIGGNAKLNEFSAAMGLCNLRHIDEYIAARERIVARYRERLEGVAGIHLVQEQENVTTNYAYFSVLIDEEFGGGRDAVFAALNDEGIGSRKYFYPLISDFACYRNLYKSIDVPVAKQVANQVLTLPLYSDLLLADVDRICDTILAGRCL